MNIKDKDIVTFKMVSGDEVVAKMVKITDFQGYTVSKPHGVMMAQQGFGLVPWILTVDPDTKIHIAQEAVASVNKTHEAVAKQYIKQTTGLLIP